jgi:hypothetical protein
MIVLQIRLCDQLMISAGSADLIASALRRAAGEWLPIETAPRDGHKILLAKFVGHPDHATCLWWCVAGHWSARWKNWNDGIEPCGLADPTYWREVPKPFPFPAPPEPDHD